MSLANVSISEWLVHYTAWKSHPMTSFTAFRLVMNLSKCSSSKSKRLSVFSPLQYISPTVLIKIILSCEEAGILFRILFGNFCFSKMYTVMFLFWDRSTMLRIDLIVTSSRLSICNNIRQCVFLRLRNSESRALMPRSNACNETPKYSPSLMSRLILVINSSCGLVCSYS